jgi:uncharacterized protein (TIGR00725 family)
MAAWGFTFGKTVAGPVMNPVAFEEFAMWDCRRRTIIGVMGGADPNLGTEILREAEETGRLIASAGAVLLCGGRTGVMEAAARGAKSLACGETLAILPGSDPEKANPHMDWVVATGMGNGRNIINILSSDAIIAFPGGAGTLSEIALAIKCGIHVVVHSAWNLHHGQGALSTVDVDRFCHRADSPGEGVRKALAHARKAVDEPETLKGEIKALLEKRTLAWSRGDGKGWLDCHLPSEEVTLVMGGSMVRGYGRKLEKFFEERQPESPDPTFDAASLHLAFLAGRMVHAAYRLRGRAPGGGKQDWWCTSVLVNTRAGYRILMDHMGAAL